MLKKFLIWISSFRKSHVLAWIKQVKDDKHPRDEIVFFNTLLKFLKKEEFKGLADLHKLSIRLGRSISVYTIYPLFGCHDCINCIGTIEPESTREALEKIAKDVEPKCGGYCILSYGNPNLPWEIKPRIYV